MRMHQATADLARQLKIRNWVLAIVGVEIGIIELARIVPLFG